MTLAAVKAIILAAALAHAVSGDDMLRVAECESTYRPLAVSADGQNLGLYQLNRRGRLPEFYALGYDDVWDASQQADYFAGRLAEHDVAAWTCARRFGL